MTFDEASFYDPNVDKTRLLVKLVNTGMLADLLQQEDAPEKEDLTLRNQFEDLSLDEIPHFTTGPIYYHRTVG